MRKKTIDIEGLWWRYEGGEEWALRGVDLEVGEGEVVGIVGPNGAGKTTLCLAMAGLIPHAVTGEMKGSVYVAGADTRTMDLRDIVRRVGMLFQNPESQFVAMSVLDEVAFGLENFGYPYEEMRDRIRWSLEVAGLPGYEEKHPLALSSGQKQRLALASILALRPDVVILDEPTSSLDCRGCEEVFSTIQNLKETLGTTFIIVEHNTEALVELADRIVLLDEGEVVRAGTPQRFFQGVGFLAAKGVWIPQGTELGERLFTSGLWEGELPVTLEAAQGMMGSLVAGQRLPASTCPELPHLEPPLLEPPPSILSPKIPRDPVIETRNLSYTYLDGTRALRDVDLIVGRGEYVALLGQNGSGKTTLAKHFLGLLRPTSGLVMVDGIDIRQVPVKELVSKVGFVFQNADRQLFCETVEDELAYGPRNLGLSREEVERRVREALFTLEIAHLRGVTLVSLRGAARQRVALASVLAMQPEILIVDEPSACQERRLSDLLMRLLREWNVAGKTVILATHNMRLVAEHATRVVILDRGQVVLDAPTRVAFAATEQIERAGLRPPQITQLAQSLVDRSFLPNVALTVAEAFAWARRLPADELQSQATTDRC
jgi:energy-coupling factor transporter ATP-binding protein EcfA2